jgi:hypothetical protein
VDYPEKNCHLNLLIAVGYVGFLCDVACIKTQLYDVILKEF